MKRLIAIFMTAVILLGMTACLPANPGSAGAAPEQMTIQMGETHTDFEGVNVQIANATWDDNGMTLKVKWVNSTGYEVIYGASYVIERKEGDAWISCATVDDLVFNALAYILSAGQTNEETYEVSRMFDVSKAGTYRFKSDCSVADGNDDSDHMNLWAEFTLGNIKCPDDSKETGTEVEWHAQYIRTNGYQDGAKFPRVSIIRSVKELNGYYEANKDTFDLERNPDPGADFTKGFLDACDQYDDAFFEKNYLIFVLLEEGSGSVRHEVRGVEQTSKKKISVSIGREVPEVGTADMAEWHIILELSRDAIVESPNDIQVYLDGTLAWNGSVVEPPKPEAAFKKPPEGTLRTPEGDVTLIAAGYNWTYENPDGTAVSTIADQASRPLPADSLTPVTISRQYAETVYLPVPGSGEYEPTNCLGYLVKFAWEDSPAQVTCTCWPDTVWQDSSISGEQIPADLNGGPFYAKEGGYIYEFATTWEDTGAGYYGTVNYYVYIVGGEDHSHQVAAEAQTVEDPITGYCGNTWTTLHIGDKEYSFMYGHSVTLTDILINLNYDPNRVCNCAPEYTVDTEFGTGYGINLTQGYARCEKGQADLTQEQIDKIAEIIEWAETTNCQYPLNS